MSNADQDGIMVERVARWMKAALKGTGDAYVGHASGDTLESTTVEGDVDFLALARAAIGAMNNEVEALRAALAPFAAITPARGYASDGSEAEGYSMLLWETDRLGHQKTPDFTGADLARARGALSESKS